MISIILLFIFFTYLTIDYYGVSILLINIILFLSFLKYKNIILKLEVPIYLISIALSILVYLDLDNNYLSLISTGVLPISLMTYLMIVGLFNKEGVIYPTYANTRKIVSITMFILISPHVFKLLFTNIQAFGIIGYVVMIPLTLTSFNVVRQEIDNKDWKRIQLISYIAYIAVYIHIIIVSYYINTNLINFGIYLSIISVYIVTKINNFLRRHL